jgi:hypothetical protein
VPLSCNMILPRKSRKILKGIKRIRVKAIWQPQRLKQLIYDFNLKSSGLIMRINELMERLSRNNGG